MLEFQQVQKSYGSHPVFSIPVTSLPPGVYMLPLLGRARTFRLLLKIQTVLYLPVILYATAVFVIAIYMSAWIAAIMLVVFIASICLGNAALYQYHLFYPGGPGGKYLVTRRSKRKRYTPYWSFLLRRFSTEHTSLLVGIKVFGCGILYLLLKIQTPDDYDIRMPFLIFSLALFGHGALIYQLRRTEEQQLLFHCKEANL